MPLSAFTTTTASAVLALVTLVGLAVRKRAGASAAFTAYLLSVVVGLGALVLVPSHLWNWEYWLLGDVLQTSLRIIVPFEITYKTYRALPEGLRRLRRIMLVLAVLIAAAVFMFPGRLDSAYHWTLVCARVSYGTIFLFVAYLLFSQYHRVPMDPVFRDVAVGFTYLATMTAFTDTLAHLDARIGWGQDILVALTYPTLLAWWAWHMWAPEEPSGLSRESMQIMQPWRVKRIKWTP